MFVYKIRPDGVYEYAVEVPDGTTKIPKGHTFSKPPEIPEGHYARMIGGWKIIAGEKPIYPPLPTREEIKKNIVDSTQDRLDKFAQTRKYDGILSACTYATSTVEKFRIEGQYCVEVRDATWIKLYEVLNDVESGVRPMPTDYSDIVSELPELRWPEEPVVEISQEDNSVTSDTDQL
jgi:hypothetical protein